MRSGEIVRTTDGTILRKPEAVNIPFGMYEIVTVAELFDETRAALIAHMVH